MCPGRTTSPLPFFSPKNLGFESVRYSTNRPVSSTRTWRRWRSRPRSTSPRSPRSPSRPKSTPSRSPVHLRESPRRRACARDRSHSHRRPSQHAPRDHARSSHALAPSSRRPRSSSRRRRRLPRARRSVPPTSRRVDRSFSNTSFSRFLEYDTRDHTIATTYHVLFKNSSMRGFRTAKFYVKNDRTHGTSTSNRSFGQTRRGIDGESTPHDATRARTRCKFL